MVIIPCLKLLAQYFHSQSPELMLLHPIKEIWDLLQGPGQLQFSVSVLRSVGLLFLQQEFHISRKENFFTYVKNFAAPPLIQVKI